VTIDDGIDKVLPGSAKSGVPHNFLNAVKADSGQSRPVMAIVDETLKADVAEASRDNNRETIALADRFAREFRGVVARRLPKKFLTGS